MDEPYDAGRNITVTTTGYRTLADYEVRDLTVQCVSLWWIVISGSSSRCRPVMYSRTVYLYMLRSLAN